MFEWATNRRTQLYAIFVDLSKAYDSVLRSRLFEALVGELSLPPDLVKALVLLYTDVR